VEPTQNPQESLAAEKIKLSSIEASSQASLSRFFLNQSIDQNLLQI
jgi:hypothetical protein